MSVDCSVDYVIKIVGDINIYVIKIMMFILVHNHSQGIHYTGSLSKASLHPHEKRPEENGRGSYSLLTILTA